MRPFPWALFFGLLALLLVFNDNDFFQFLDLFPSGPYLIHHEHLVVLFTVLAMCATKR